MPYPYTMKCIVKKALGTTKTTSVIPGMIPIVWFGDYEAYSSSPTKIITVGLNPSDREFGNPTQPCTSLRFPAYTGCVCSLIKALNGYFHINPYNDWFKSGFEPILNGLNASYYGGKTNTALHTDICSPWATNPTWSKLPRAERETLMKEGFPLWMKLIQKLAPDIILFSIPQRHIDRLKTESNGLLTQNQPLCIINTDSKGIIRKRPIVIGEGAYGSALAIFGKTWNVPFGALSRIQKSKLGGCILSTMGQTGLEPSVLQHPDYKTVPIGLVSNRSIVSR